MVTYGILRFRSSAVLRELGAQRVQFPSSRQADSCPAASFPSNRHAIYAQAFSLHFLRRQRLFQIVAGFGMSITYECQGCGKTVTDRTEYKKVDVRSGPLRSPISLAIPPRRQSKGARNKKAKEAPTSKGWSLFQMHLLCPLARKQSPKNEDNQRPANSEHRILPRECRP